MKIKKITIVIIALINLYDFPFFAQKVPSLS